MAKKLPVCDHCDPADVTLTAADLKGPRNVIMWAVVRSEILGLDRLIPRAIGKSG